MEKKLKQWHSEHITVHNRFLDDFKDDFEYILATMALLFIDVAKNHFTGGVIKDSFNLEFFEGHEDNFIGNRVTIRFSARGYIDDADYLTQVLEEM